MGAKIGWRTYLGVAMIASTFTDFAPAGPWNDSTFTSGGLGLLGLCLLYLEWFRITFGEGLVPTVDRWKDPAKTSKKVMSIGLAILLLAYIIGKNDFFPVPAGLVLSLIAMLITTNGFYVWMVSVGPLKSIEEENNDVEIDQKSSEENEDVGIDPKGSEEYSGNPANITYNIQNIEIHDSVVMDSKFTNEEE